MHKIVHIDIGARCVETVYSIVEINSEEEYVVLPTHSEQHGQGAVITRIGYKQLEREDTRSDYEKWKDAYYYNYYPTSEEIATEVPVSPNIKKIFIPATVTDISKWAFKNLTDMTFEIDEKNEHYRVEDNKIIEISSGKVIWPFSE